MKIWYYSQFDAQRRLYEADGNRVRVGRRSDNDIVLNSPFIADEAAVFFRHDNLWELNVLDINGVHVGDHDLLTGQRVNIECNEKIKLFPYTLVVELPSLDSQSADFVRQRLDDEMTQLMLAVHLDLLVKMDLSTSDISRSQSNEYLYTLERNLEEITRLKGLFHPTRAALLSHVAGHCARSALLASLLEQSQETAAGLWSPSGHWSQIVTAVPDRELELDEWLRYVSEIIEIGTIRGLSGKIDAIDRRFWEAWEDVDPKLLEELREYLALRHVKKQIKDVVFGYGPIEDLLQIPTISEIMVVDKDHIYIEKNGVLENTGRRFFSDEVTEAIIARIVARVGRRIDKAQPLVDARLSDGSRVNAVIPPLAVSGPCLTIRKFPERSLQVADLVAKGALTRTVADFLRAAVVTRRNILISGGTGSGKTTLLNCLSDFIPDRERIVTIEDTAELQLKKEHVVRLEARAANIEGAGAYTIRDLVRNALRMRPDRVVVGECRAGEALDMLQAMNTGHDGSMTTIHANSPADVVLRLEVLVQMASPLPVESIRRQIASAIDLIIQLGRLRNGRRIVQQVSQVVGIDRDTSEVCLRDLFIAEGPIADDVRLQPTGRMPTFMPELIESGLIQLESFYL